MSPLFKQKKAKAQKIRKYHRYENVTPKERLLEPPSMEFDSHNVVNSFNAFPQSS